MNKLNRDEMIKWLEQYIQTVKTTEEFREDMKGGIWVSGEHGYEYQDKEIYSYYAEDYSNRSLGILNSWEDELEARGWYSEWYDAGTVMIYKD